MDLVFLPVNITCSLQLKFLKHLLFINYPGFLPNWTEASYNQKIVSREIFLLTFPSFLLSLQLTAKVGETLGSTEPL